MYSAPRDQHSFPITFSSSVADDVWHAQKGAFAFESWHFDALSDDGREALIISFYDNYPYSPRYIGANDRNGEAEPHPAVSLVYSVDGRAALNAVNEYTAAELKTGTQPVSCTIGSSWFRVGSAEYGTGYVLNVELVTARRRRIKAELEWLSIESDLLRPAPEDGHAAVGWNIVSPRSDVSGRITTYSHTGEVINVHHFRGTGCHDHLRSAGCLDEIFEGRCWGRAHFVDATAVFQAVKTSQGETTGNIFLIADGALSRTAAECDGSGFVLSRFGIKVAREIKFSSDDVDLEIWPASSIDSGFCEVRMVAKMRLTLAGERTEESQGIVSIAAPGRFRKRLIRRLSGLRIGTDGHPPLF